MFTGSNYRHSDRSQASIRPQPTLVCSCVIRDHSTAKVFNSDSPSHHRITVQCISSHESALKFIRHVCPVCPCFPTTRRKYTDTYNISVTVSITSQRFRRGLKFCAMYRTYNCRTCIHVKDLCV